MDSVKAAAVFLTGMFLAEVAVPVTQSLLKIKNTSDGATHVVDRVKQIFGLIPDSAAASNSNGTNKV